MALNGARPRAHVHAVAIALLVTLVFSLGAAACAVTATADARASSGANSQRAPTSQLRARATVLPLLAVMVCTRLCPVAGLAAARIIPRASKLIKHVRAPNPALAQKFSAAAGSSASQTLGVALTRGNAAQAAALRAQGYVAHHIVAHGHPRAEFARMVLFLRGIGPNSAANGVWLKASTHYPVHTNAYFQNVNRVVARYYFSPFEPKAKLVADLQQIGRLLQAGQFPL